MKKSNKLSIALLGVMTCGMLISCGGKSASGAFDGKAFVSNNGGDTISFEHGSAILDSSTEASYSSKGNEITIKYYTGALKTVIFNKKDNVLETESGSIEAYASLPKDELKKELEGNFFTNNTNSEDYWYFDESGIAVHFYTEAKKDKKIKSTDYVKYLVKNGTVSAGRTSFVFDGVTKSLKSKIKDPLAYEKDSKKSLEKSTFSAGDLKDKYFTNKGGAQVEDSKVYYMLLNGENAIRYDYRGRKQGEVKYAVVNNTVLFIDGNDVEKFTFDKAGNKLVQTEVKWDGSELKTEFPAVTADAYTKAVKSNPLIGQNFAGYIAESKSNVKLTFKDDKSLDIEKRSGKDKSNLTWTYKFEKNDAKNSLSTLKITTDSKEELVYKYSENDDVIYMNDGSRLNYSRK
ncbi:hypothetical protein [Treponema zioleckii]|uniref:hypothetical protein n=1 Tax=Treponema zioleckii TaxID=331680 RepID=UPI00168B3A40|nr:hypothetical protein [Treponema zioleckii]